MLIQFAELQNILLLKFFISLAMENQSIGGALVRWSMKWLLGYLHFIRRADLSYLTRLNSATQTYLHMLVISLETFFNLFSKKNQKIVLVRKMAQQILNLIHGSKE